MWCDNIGLVSLIYLGREFICVVCITLLCVQPIPTLSAFFLCHPYIPLSNLKNFFIYLSPLFLCSVMIVEGIVCCRFVCMCVFDSIVRKCVPVND